MDKLKELIAPHIESYNYAISKLNEAILDLRPGEIQTDPKSPSFLFWIRNISIQKPQRQDGSIQEKKVLLYPSECRRRGISYSGTLTAEIVLQITGDLGFYRTVTCELGKMPVMVLSKLCNLYGLTEEQLVEKKEEPFEMGGYFISNGLEKVFRMIIQSRKHYIFTLKRPKFTTKGPYYTQFATFIRCSRSDESSQQVYLHYLSNGVLMIRIIIQKQEFLIPAILILKCFVETSDKEIYDRITEFFPNNSFIAERVEVLLRDFQNYHLRNKSECLQYIGSRFRPLLFSPMSYTNTKCGEEFIRRFIFVHLNNFTQRDKNINLSTNIVIDNTKTNIYAAESQMQDQNDSPDEDEAILQEGEEISININSDSNRAKFDLMITMIHKLYSLVLGEIGQDNSDSPSFQEVLLPGHLYLTFFKQKLQEWIFQQVNVMKKMAGIQTSSLKYKRRKQKKELSEEEKRRESQIRKLNPDYLGKSTFYDANFFLKCLKKNSFDIGKKFDFLIATGNADLIDNAGLPQQAGLSIIAEKINFLRYVSHFRSIHRGSFFSTMKTTKIRRLLPEYWGFICVDPDTNVLLADSKQQIKIKHLQNKVNNDNFQIATINRKSFLESASKIKNFFVHRVDRLFHITTITGHSIKITGYHPLLVLSNQNSNSNSNFIYIYGDKLKVGNFVWIRHIYQNYEKQKEEQNKEQMILSDQIYKDRLSHLQNESQIDFLLNQFCAHDLLPFTNSNQKILDMARFSAIFYTIGFLKWNKTLNLIQAKITVDDINDKQELIQELQSNPLISNLQIKKKDGFICKFQGILPYFLYSLGIPLRDETPNKIFPNWLFKCNKLIQKEFLASYLGTLNINSKNILTDFQKGNEKYLKINTPKLFPKKNNSIFQNQMRKLLQNLNLELTNHYSKSNKLEYEIKQSLSNMDILFNQIGVYYNNSETKQFCLLGEFIRYINHNFIKNSKKTKAEWEDRSIIKLAKQAFSLKKFRETFKQKDQLIAIPIEKIEILEKKRAIVMDIETSNGNHTFITNGFVSHNCPVHTPDGAPCGLLNHLSSTCEVVNYQSDLSTIPKVISRFEGFVSIYPYIVKKKIITYPIMLDGCLIGRVIGGKLVETENQTNRKKSSSRIEYDNQYILKIADQLRMLKVSKKNGIPENLEIVPIEKQTGSLFPGIYLFTRPARMMRPVINLLTKTIEKIGTFEQTYLNIALNVDDIKLGISTHMEIKPTNILSIVANLTPFSDFNQSPRNMYQCQMAKQTMGFPGFSIPYRSDNKLYRLHTLQKPIVQTKSQKYFGIDEYPLGANAIVAVISYTGYDMEDAMIINKGSYERGFGHGTVYKNTRVVLSKEQSKYKSSSYFTNHTEEEPDVPIEPNLDLDGLPTVGTVLKEGMAMMRYYNPETGKSNVLKYKNTEVAIVDGVAAFSSDQTDRLDGALLRLRYKRNPVIGDKFCLTEDHEVLTQSGWKFISDLKINEKIATLVDMKYLQYSPVLALYQYQNNSNLFSVSNDFLDLVCTWEHKLFVKNSSKSGYSLQKASEVKSLGLCWYKKNCSNQFPERKVFDLSLISNLNHNDLDENNKDKVSHIVEMNTWILFFGVYIRLLISDRLQKDETKKTIIFKMEDFQESGNGAKIISLCKQLGFSYQQTKESISVFSELLFKQLEDVSLSKLPKWCFELSENQSRLLLITILDCEEQMKETEDIERGYSDKMEADHIQRLCLHSGLSCDIIGMKMRINQKEESQEPKYEKKENEEFYHEGKVYCPEVSSGIFFVRRNGKVMWTGNSSRHGQKGVLSWLWPEMEMPFSESGLRPDIIINPHAFPSRMTIGMLIESMAGKVGSVYGEYQDATPFNFDEENRAVDYFGKKLLEAGYNYYGNEVLYSGVNGNELHADIFFGVVYYQRLKHMVGDKFQVRSTGRVNMLTRQPLKGRKVGGGIRFGEMERDSLLAHGTPFLLQDRLLNSSDIHITFICRKCGSVLSPLFVRGDSVEEKSIKCLTCDSKQYIEKVQIPYVFRFLTSELAAMNIKLTLELK